MELAERHGWTDDPAVGVACTVVGVVLVYRGQPDEAEPWVQRAERTLTAETHPIAVLASVPARDAGADAGSNAEAALAALEAATAGTAARRPQHYLFPRIRALLVHSLVRLGEVERAEQFLAGLGEQDRQRANSASPPRRCGLRKTTRTPRSPSSPPSGTSASVSEDYWGFWRARADVLEAPPGTRSAIRPPPTAPSSAHLTCPSADGAVTPFLLYPAAGPARPPHPAPHRPCRPDRRDPRPARRKPDGAAAGRRRRPGPSCCWSR